MVTLYFLGKSISIKSSIVTEMTICIVFPFPPVRAVHVAALVAVEGAQLGAVLDEGARDGGGVGPAPLQLREEDAGVEVVQLLQVTEDGGGGVGGHAELVSGFFYDG